MLRTVPAEYDRGGRDDRVQNLLFPRTSSFQLLRLVHLVANGAMISSECFQEAAESSFENRIAVMLPAGMSIVSVDGRATRCRRIWDG